MARRGRTVVFCEGKSKGGGRFGDPLEMVSPKKLHRLRHAAKAWFAANPDCGGLAIGFEVLAVRGSKTEGIAA